VSRGALALLAAAWLATAALAASAATPVSPATDQAVTAVATQLRCVVCQNLSVADSPSETARQMREVIRERLARGETPEEVIAYFADKYGEWVLLSPRPRGFNLLVWVLPFVAVALGVLVVLRAAARWTRCPAEPPEALAPADRERLRRELERLADEPRP